MSKNVVLLTDEVIGTTPETKLGKKLLTAFLYSMCNVDDDQLPSHIILYTEAAKLATKEDQNADHLKELISKGVDVVICGACADYFELNSDIKFGRISNMLDIVEIMNNSAKVIRP
ncbi:hypothetical protein Zmor_011800 [Zophobas morio]|uniref:Sulfurtransferase-like selenium metabolism protein YedF n=1 Tax=Zophobas morio TaxID=2755281 RepID=A0AA38HI21_9CUCU|nr:hypothetical protein Zmor_011800 [Zophobas morio]